MSRSQRKRNTESSGRNACVKTSMTVNPLPKDEAKVTNIVKRTINEVIVTEGDLVGGNDCPISIYPEAFVEGDVTSCRN